MRPGQTPPAFLWRIANRCYFAGGGEKKGSGRKGGAKSATKYIAAGGRFVVPFDGGTNSALSKSITTYLPAGIDNYETNWTSPWPPPSPDDYRSVPNGKPLENDSSLHCVRAFLTRPRWKKLNSTLNLLLSLSPSFRLSSFLPSSTFQRWWKVAMVDGWRGWGAESGGNLIARAYQTCQRHKRRGYRHACNFQHKGGRSLARGPISMETSQADVHSLY